MACDTTLKPRQTIQERAAEVRRALARIDALLASGKVTAKVSPQGAVTFVGISAQDRDGITDACTYRRIMTTGSSLARAALQRAEQLAGRQVSRQVIGQGTHSHDNGRTWHQHKG